MNIRYPACILLVALASSCNDDVPSRSCAPNTYDFGTDAGGLLGYLWNGTACIARPGMLCEGACPGLYFSLEACRAAYASCMFDAGSH